MDHGESGRVAVSAAADFIRRRREQRDEERLYVKWRGGAEAEQLRKQGKPIPHNYWFYLKYRNHYSWITVALATLKLTNEQPCKAHSTR